MRILLAEDETFERAKGILMEKDQLTEEAAFGQLRKASQSSGPADEGDRRGGDSDARPGAVGRLSDGASCAAL